MFDVLSSSHVDTAPAGRLRALGCAVALALGYGEDDYWAAYRANIGAQTREALDASPIAQAVLALMDGRNERRGAPSDLFGELNRVAEDLRLDTKAKAWPKNPSWVTRRLTLVVPNLAQVGITVQRGSVGEKRWVALNGTKNAVNGVSPVGDQLGAADGTDGIDTISATLQGKTRRGKPLRLPPAGVGPPLPTFGSTSAAPRSSALTAAHRPAEGPLAPAVSLHRHQVDRPEDEPPAGLLPLGLVHQAHLDVAVHDTGQQGLHHPRVGEQDALSSQVAVLVEPLKSTSLARTSWGRGGIGSLILASSGASSSPTSRATLKAT